ncbi:MAG: HAD-IB family phosphatase [Candidatus Undinarchaeales archaeon]|nr:HAD-IB family phosphatase [Candidatus Undinarchaeales archaeon]
MYLMEESNDAPGDEGTSDLLVLYDMDGTLLQGDGLRNVYEGIGGEPLDNVEEAHARYGNGEIGYFDLHRASMENLKGVEASLAQELAGATPLFEDATVIVDYMVARGYDQSILSHSPTDLIAPHAQRLGIGTYFGVDMVCEGGRYTGDTNTASNYTRTLLSDMDAKATVMRDLAQGRKVIAFGNGSNDYSMLDAADMGFAIHANQHLRELVEDGDSQNIYLVDSFEEAIEVLDRELG